MALWRLYDLMGATSVGFFFGSIYDYGPLFGSVAAIYGADSMYGPLFGSVAVLYRTFLLHGVGLHFIDGSAMAIGR